MKKPLIKTSLITLLVLVFTSLFFSYFLGGPKVRTKALNIVEQLNEEIELDLEDNVVYDENGVSICVTDISKKGSRIDFEIKNNSTFDIYCDIRSVVINGFSLDSAYHQIINPNSTSSYHVEFSNNKKKMFGFDNIETLRFQMRIQNKEEDILLDNPIIEINTTALNPGRQFNYDDYELLNSDNGISIYYSKVDNEDNPYLLLVANETDEDVMVSFSDMEFDDKLLPPLHINTFVCRNSISLDKGIYSDNPAIQVMDNISQKPTVIRFDSKVTVIDEEGNLSRTTFRLNNSTVNLE